MIMVILHIHKLNNVTRSFKHAEHRVLSQKSCSVRYYEELLLHISLKPASVF